MKTFNKKNTAIGLGLCGVLAMGAIAAYFVDKDDAENTFTIGKIDIDLTEPNWNPENGEDITPNKEVAKDPTVQNIGENDAYIFAKVAVPFVAGSDIELANADGTKVTSLPERVELFSYELNNGWVEVGQPTVENGKLVHLYAYGTDAACTSLAKEASTPAVFNSVKMANVLENHGMSADDWAHTLQTAEEKLNVTAYGIQTNDLNGGKTAPADVWSVLNNQIQD